MVALAPALRSVARPKQLAINARIRVEVLRNTFHVMNEIFVGCNQQSKTHRIANVIKFRFVSFAVS
jgi:hypothetical protein